MLSAQDRAKQMLRISVADKLVNESHALETPIVAAGRARPRVLQVGKFYHPHQGGMETHLRSLCGELRKSVNLDVVVAHDRATTTQELVDGIRVTRVATPLNLASSPVCPSLSAHIRKSQADLVHIHLPHPTALLSYLASGHRGRLVITYHSDIIRQKMLGKMFWPFLKRGLARADAIIVASPNYLQTSSVLQQFSDRCHIVPFGIPLEPFAYRNQEKVAAIRRRYKLPLILAVGRLVYYKGFEFLVRAMRQVPGHLVIVGKGPLHAKLQEEARQAGISDKVTILDNVEDVVPYYQAADVFVLPSVARSEAFGIVQLEAMACHKPVINTNLDSGVPFVSLDGVTGLTVAPGDADALSHALNNLLSNSQLMADYGAAGRRRVEQIFSLEVMARQTLRIYQQVSELPSVL